MNQFDTVIIGGGPGGMRAARLLAEAKKKVALVNTELGGECLNWGCIPTKAFLFAEELIEKSKHAQDFGINTEFKGIDFAKIMAREKDVVETLKKQVEQFFKTIGITLIPGRGEIISSTEVKVKTNSDEEQTFQTKHIIIATGSDARLLPNLERNNKIIISNDIFKLTEVPEKLTIIGGGAIGVEFASVFAAFGSKVTIIEMAEHLLPTEDPDLGMALQKSFEKRGIEIQTGTVADNPNDLDADKVLIAIGRTPSFNPEELDKVGIKHEKHGITTNGQMQTNVPNIYAIGDVAWPSRPKALLAYTAEREGEIAAQNILGNSPTTLNYNFVPSTIFCHPEVAHIGLTKEQAGENAVAAKGYYLANGKATILNKRDGFIKVVAEKGTGTILGVHIIGDKATELIHTATVMVSQKLTTKQALETVFAHPVISEVLQDALQRTEKMI